MLDFHATPTEYEKGESIVMAINIASLRDWNVNLTKKSASQPNSILVGKQN